MIKKAEIVVIEGKAISWWEYESKLIEKVRKGMFDTVEHAYAHKDGAILFETVLDYIDWKSELVENTGSDTIIDSEIVINYIEKEKRRNLRDALAEMLERVYCMPNGQYELGLINSETGELVFGQYGALAFSAQQLAQWDYSDEEWEEMDFGVLADDLIGNIEWEEDEEIFVIKHV